MKRKAHTKRSNDNYLMFGQDRWSEIDDRWQPVYYDSNYGDRWNSRSERLASGQMNDNQLGGGYFPNERPLRRKKKKPTRRYR